MTKLTNSIRDNIRSDLLRHRFLEEAKQIFEEHKIIAKRIYFLRFTDAEHKLIAEMPPRWLPTNTSMTVIMANGNRHNFNFGGIYLKGLVRSDGEERIFPEYSDYRTFRPAVDSNISKIIELHRLKLEDFEQKYNKAEREIRSVLDSVTTVKKLITVWEEVRPFAEKYLDEKTPGTALMIPVEALNKELNLPVKGE